MQPRIFAGKKRKYNKMILKALYKSGYLTPWNIAKQIAFEDKKFTDGDWYHKTQKINSVIQRKGGRLSELEKKQYIQNTEKGYRLTIYKGISVALLLFEEIEDSGIDELPILLQYMDERLRPGFQETWELYAELYQKKEMYHELKKAVKMLLEEGLDFDVISDIKFNSYLQMRLDEEMLKIPLQKDRPPLKPEVYVKMLSAFEKIMGVYRDQVKEFEKASEAVEESLRKLGKQKTGNVERTEEA